MAQSPHTAELYRLLSSAKVYDLEQPRYPGMPYFPTQAPGYLYFLPRRHGDVQMDPHKHNSSTTATSGLINSADHVGTHIDALCHIAYEGRLYGGIKVPSEIERANGYSKNGAEEIPSFILPGVFLDIPSMKGQDILPEGYEITKEDLEEACRSEKAEVKKDGAVIVRTGYGKLWSEPQRYGRAAGLSREANQWLADKGVKLVGADNMSVDPSIPSSPSKVRPHFAHEYLLPQRGVYLVENMNLESLAADRIYEILLICFPLKFKGATAAWTHPVAIKL